MKGLAELLLEGGHDPAPMWPWAAWVRWQDQDLVEELGREHRRWLFWRAATEPGTVCIVDGFQPGIDWTPKAVATTLWSRG